MTSEASLAGRGERGYPRPTVLSSARAGLRRLARLWPGSRPPTGTTSGPATAAIAEPAAAPIDVAELRAVWSDQLWGDGFALPGGEAEVLHLARLLPLSAATTLLLLGQDAGGATRTLASRHRAWVMAYQHDARRAARMTLLLRPLGRRAAVKPWTPAAPGFGSRYHHHALALEALHSGAEPGLLCRAMAAALKPGGHLVMTETVASSAQPGPGFARWLALDGREAPPPGRGTVEAAVQAAGFTLHVTEALDTRRAAAATDAWLRLLAGLRQSGRPASPAGAAALVAEAERWLLWQRLLCRGDLAVIRWHATLPG